LDSFNAGQLRRETAAAKGERMIAEELRRLGWSERDLAIRRKNDPDKLAIAVRLRRETTLSIKTIAARVLMGTSNTANARMSRWFGTVFRLTLLLCLIYGSAWVC
jgi:hypothetical protein